MPHHRHHHSKGADKYPADSLDLRRPPNTRYLSRNNSLNLGRLNRDPSPPNDHDAVESWLGGVVAHTSRPRPRSPRFREETIEYPRRQLPRDARSRNNGCAERLGPAWRPHQIIPKKTSHSPRKLHPGPEKSPNRSKHRRNDSSLISGFENTAKPSHCGLVSALSEDEQIAPKIPLGRENRSVGDLSDVSHLDELESFERRPRRKTKEDKYDMKKKGGPKHEATRGEGQHSHRRKRTKRTEKKRKPAMPSTNVMNNFTSDAVMNNRITVQPTLKPGLFDNGRLSKGQPIPDLAFSEMQFLKYREREPQPKPLSRSRVRERRRENREIERVSSFFLPSKMGRKPKQQTDSTLENHRNGMKASNRYRQDLVSQNRPRSIETTVSQRHPATANHKLSPSIHDRAYRNPAHSSSDLERGPESSKATTYFTWSSSHRSSQPPRRHFETSSYCSDTARTVTPELVRSAIIATGVYRDTGISPYGDSTNRKGDSAADCDSSTNGYDPGLSESHNQDQRAPSVSPVVDYRTNVIATNDMSEDLKQRWRSILPPEWRLERNAASCHASATENYQTQNPTKNKEPKSLQDSGFIDCQNMARIESNRTDIPACGATPPTSQAIDPSNKHNTEIIDSALLKLGQDKCDQVPESQDRASQASREAMPPPSLPIGRNNAARRNTDSNIESGPNSTANNSRETTRNSPGNLLAQHNPDLGVCCNALISTLGPSTNTERTNLSLETMSWIPQTRSLSIINDASCRALSRMSTKTPIYVSQLDEKSRTTLPSTQRSGRQSTESICEFIARIEKEAEEDIYPEDPIPVDQETGLSAATLKSPIAHVETNHQSISVPSELPEEFVQYSTGLQYAEQDYEGSRSNRISMDNGNMGGLMEDGRDTKLPELTQSSLHPFEDVDDERLEMSQFWRPNYLSPY